MPPMPGHRRRSSVAGANALSRADFCHSLMSCSITLKASNWDSNSVIRLSRSLICLRSACRTPESTTGWRPVTSGALDGAEEGWSIPQPFRARDNKPIPRRQCAAVRRRHMAFGMSEGMPFLASMCMSCPRHQYQGTSEPRRGVLEEGIDDTTVTCECRSAWYSLMASATASPSAAGRQ